MKKSLLTALCIGLLAANCNEDENPIEENTPVGGNTVVSASFHWKWGPDALDTSQTYTTALGEKITIKRVQFYLAQPYFQNDSSAVVADFPGKYMLIDSYEGALVRTIGEVNGHLHTLQITLGLDSIANHSDPSQYAADHALSVSNGMHWSWNQGYVFMKVDGRYDFNNDGIVEPAGGDMPFSFHCAGDGLRENATVEVELDALTGGAAVLDLVLDLDVLLGSTDIEGTPIISGETPVTRALMNNLSSALSTP